MTGPSAHDGRNETELERRDRQFGELLQELRVVQTGVQVLFAFLLGVPFASRFTTLDSGQRLLYFVALILSGLSVILLLAPTAHRCLASGTAAPDHGVGGWIAAPPASGWR